MEKPTLFKGLVLLFSLTVFMYQSMIALHKLFNPPIVETSEVLDINDIELPNIFICHKDLMDWNKITEYGYYSFQEMLLGFGNDMFGFGAKNNASFWEMVDDVMKFDIKDKDCLYG